MNSLKKTISFVAGPSSKLRRRFTTSAFLALPRRASGAFSKIS